MEHKNKFNKIIGFISLIGFIVLSVIVFFIPPKEDVDILDIEFIEEIVEEAIEDIIEIEEDLTTTLVKETIARIENQEKVDAQIIAEVESGYYTPANPLVILDPYSYSPLTALICFTTDTPTRVEIHIPGDDYFTEVNHSFSEVSTQHIIPVYGLYADTLNEVILSVYSDDNLIDTSVVEIQTELLPNNLANLIILTETFEDSYQEGINFMYENKKMAFDKNGDIRWFFSENDFLMAGEYNYLDNKFFLVKGNYHVGTAIFYELDKLGKIYSTYYSPYGNHHDISLLSNEIILILGSNTFGQTIEDFIYEIDISTGEIKNTLDLKYVLQRSRPAWHTLSNSGISSRTDWLHINSIEYDSSDNTIIISSNYQSSIVKLDWATGDIKWILSNHNDWNPRLQQYLLTPIGDDFEWSYNQHAAEILPDYDNNPDTVDILLFDNSTTRFYQDEELQRKIINNEIVNPERYSRLVHYRINEVTMEVEQIWQYGKERSWELFSSSRGDADLLDNGNILGLFCHDQDNFTESHHPIVSEVKRDFTLVWEAEIFRNTQTGAKYEYRAERLPFYFGDDKEHDVYSKAKNLIPQDVLDYVMGG